ncbi:hypothetical protein GCM10011339_34180 [Echinicola rosea]|uniref:Uncharacterized protein n=1 Tax=Echinicola rosea TaxID=1807691 RepID=A0ABQ1V8S6_9BACT|nr:hypothetical protein GCM10011339_34180 [Echinicola rosea]
MDDIKYFIKDVNFQNIVQKYKILWEMNAIRAVIGELVTGSELKAAGRLSKSSAIGKK